MQTTICALASGMGGAVALIRLSGPQSLAFFQTLARRQTAPEPRKQIFCTLYDGGEVLALQLRLFEEELLRYQAACVDTKTYEDTCLYAVQYTGEFQPAAQVYYPVNRAVFRLLQWDPNITELFVVEEEQERRDLLETELESYLLDEPEGSKASDDSMQPVESESETSKEPLTLYTGLPEGT